MRRTPVAGVAHDDVDALPHVEDRETVAEEVPDVGVAAMHHDLLAVAPTALAGVAAELDVLREIVRGLHASLCQRLHGRLAERLERTLDGVRVLPLFDVVGNVGLIDHGNILGTKYGYFLPLMRL
jgi:hypothetical protein